MNTRSDPQLTFRDGNTKLQASRIYVIVRRNFVITTGNNKKASCWNFVMPIRNYEKASRIYVLGRNFGIITRNNKKTSCLY